MKAAAAGKLGTAEIDDLKKTIRQQKGQLALALSVLASLGFDLELFLGVM